MMALMDNIQNTQSYTDLQQGNERDDDIHNLVD